VLYGEREVNPDGVQQLVARLQSLGIPMLYEQLPGLEHAYPDDGGAVLRRALTFIMG
jgi:acetyl esterase/lipase